MAESASHDFQSALRAGQQYVPIKVTSLRLDTTTQFALHLRIRPDEPAVLYAQKGIAFTDEARQRLVDNRVEYVYVSVDEEDEYRRYLEAHLRDILMDSTVSVADKSEILYTSAQGLVKEVLEDPLLHRGVERSKQLVRTTVNFLLRQRNALRHLIETASYDYYTYTHSVNTCVYGIALAQRVGYGDASLLREFGVGALLRDVGMSQIDPTITEHHGELSLHQYEIMKQHPILGEELLRERGGISDLALDVVRHHHEKLDGSGYPDGLRGAEIQPLVRVCTITDIFDALTTNRPHRKALSSYQALRVIHSEMRHQLDQNLYRAFVNMMGHPD